MIAHTSKYALTVISRYNLFVWLIIALLPVLISYKSARDIYEGRDTILSANYKGLRFYGNLPAIFDDFEYDSFEMNSQRGSYPLFGENEWHVRQGVIHTRGWYRYNRDDLPIPAQFKREGTFVRMFIPEGFKAEDYNRDAAISSGFTTREGTYYARVRLSSLWKWQKVRQAFWAISTDGLIFEKVTDKEKVRYQYWSEIDFEHNNHFRSNSDRRPYMDVGNHYGLIYHTRSSKSAERLSEPGITSYQEGRGTMECRNYPSDMNIKGKSVPVTDKWIDLIMTVDSTARTVTYQMYSVDDTTIRCKRVQVGSAFYPRWFMSSVFSLHWTDPTHTLQQTLAIDIDWFYYTPVTGLSRQKLEDEVRRFKKQGLVRVNTTERPTFEPHQTDLPASIFLPGPERLKMGEKGQWKLEVEHKGTSYLVDFRYRIRYRDGTTGKWQPHYDACFTYTAPPQSSPIRGLDVEVVVWDLWYPVANESPYENGWRYPSKRSHKMVTTRSISFY